MGILSDLMFIVGGAVLAFLGLSMYGNKLRREGRTDAEDDAMRDAYNRTALGRKAVQDDADSELTPDERVRRNDDQR